MRFELHLPSLFVGGAIVSVAISIPQLPQLFFQFSGVEPIFYFAGMAVLLGMVVITEYRQEGLDRGLVQMQEKHYEESRIDPAPDRIRSSETPLEWLARIYPGWRDLSLAELTALAKAGFSSQVTHTVHPTVIAGLGAAIQYTMETRVDSRWAIREIEHRIDDSEKTGKPFDLAGFLAACNAKVPSMPTDPGAYSQAPYPLMGLLTMLKRARIETGVLASAEFLWVKRLDRGSWYALNNLGRRSFHVECAGVMSHYQFITYKGPAPFPIVDPQVDGAVEGLLSYLEARGMLPSNTIESR